jgi:hypothetical protein
MFAWTVQPHIPIIIPTIAMGIFACGGLLIFISISEYLLDRCGEEQDGQSSLAASSMLRYVLAAAFSVFAVPLYSSLSAVWATMVLGFINTAFGLVPWVLLTLGLAFKRRTDNGGI